MNSEATRSQGILASLGEMDTVDVVTRLSALHLLMHIAAHGGKVLGPLALAWAMLGLVSGRIGRAAGYWAVMTLILFARVYLDTDELDNHFYLSMYWSAALAVCLWLPVERQVGALSLNAKWLLGLCMLFAVLWKIISPDYISGAFFHFFMVADNRFHDMAKLLGGLTQADLDHNFRIFSEVQNPLVPLHEYAVDLELPAGLRPLAGFMTWWTILIEAAIALVFLLPASRGILKARHAFLLVFAFTTYLVATVKGFGITLVIMGYANTPREWKRTRLAYLGAIVYIEITTIGLLSFLT